MRKLAFLCLIASALVMYACAEPNSDAPAGGIHALDGSFLDGSAHGPAAKDDLTYCQTCHGEPGGPGDNPRFNVGIDSAGGEGCESCHGANLAHPQNWAGVNTTFHYSAGNIQDACTLCHGVDLDGAGGVGPTCVECHDSPTTFTLDCTFCHSYPPDGTLHAGTVNGVDHSAVEGGFHSSDCILCHGMSESVAGGRFGASANYTLFDEDTDTIGDHWDGNIQMNADAQYNEDTYGCAECHDSDTENPLSDSGLPVVLGSYGLESGVHPMDGSYLAGDQHGPNAKQDLTVCQFCHGETGGPGDNPRFNIGILGTGCEGCHGTNYAHPQDWAGPNDTFHYSAGNIQDACTLCHGVDLDGVGGVGSTCVECHDSATTFTLDCTFCHGYPPDGSSDVATSTGVDHTGLPGFHAGCTLCHGMEETAGGGDFEPATNYTLFDALTDTIGDHWDGNINMNADAQYNPSTFGCAECHGSDTDDPMSDSGLPVVLENYSP